MMGKKKGVKKTKEVSVAIAESTSSQTPRKRGRPRKVVDQDLIKEEKQTEEELQEFEGTDSKKPRTGQEEDEDEKEDKGDTNKEKRLEEIKEVVGSSSKPRKEDDEKESPKKQQRKSRARKKGKPRKSS